MARKLLQGAKVSFVDDEGNPAHRLLFGATWSEAQVDVDLSVLPLLRRDGGYKVPTPQDFLYRSRRANPDHSAFATYLEPGRSIGHDRGQILLDFTTLNREVSRVVIAMSARRPGGMLSEMGTLRTRAMDLDTGETTYVYQHRDHATLATSCITLWTLDRVGDRWQGRVSATPYPGGPPALVRDFGAAT